MISRRKFVATSVAALSAVPELSFAKSASGKISSPALNDPDRWMEDSNSPQWKAHALRESKAARKFLNSLPGRAAYAARISDFQRDLCAVEAVQKTSAHLFVQSESSQAEVSHLTISALDGTGQRLLFDPATLAGPLQSIEWWVASPTGKYICIGLSPVGAEATILRILDVATGKLQPLSIPNMYLGRLSWLPDESGFFYIRLAAGRSSDDPDLYSDSAAWLHRMVDADASKDVRLVQAGGQELAAVTRNLWPSIRVWPGCDYAALTVQNGVEKNIALWLAPLADILAGRNAWRQLASIKDDVRRITSYGGRLFALVTRADGVQRLVQIDHTAEKPSLQNTVPAGIEGSIVDIAGAADGLYAHVTNGGLSSVICIEDATKVRYISGLPIGTVEQISATPLGTGAVFQCATWLAPADAWITTSAGSRPLGIGRAPFVPFEIDALRITVQSYDDTDVPVSLIMRKGIKATGKNPVYMDAYGAYGFSYDAYFTPMGLPFLERGGIIAVAHVRGGGEFGERWRRAGYKATKHNTWRDYIAACEGVVSAGWTTPDRLVASGGSGGGVAVGRLITTRPDLIAGAIAYGAVLNPSRFVFTANGKSNRAEFGNPDDPDELRYLVEMDSVLSAKPADYPPILCMAGGEDPRVQPWQSAKFVSALRRAQCGQSPILLSIDPDSGHTKGANSVLLQLAADEYSFALWAAGRGGDKTSTGSKNAGGTCRPKNSARRRGG
jgi:prolyl oligopeptidase